MEVHTSFGDDCPKKHTQSLRLPGEYHTDQDTQVGALINDYTPPYKDNAMHFHVKQENAEVDEDVSNARGHGTQQLLVKGSSPFEAFFLENSVQCNGDTTQEARSLSKPILTFSGQMSREMFVQKKRSV